MTEKQDALNRMVILSEAHNRIASAASLLEAKTKRPESMDLVSFGVLVLEAIDILNSSIIGIEIPMMSDDEIEEASPMAAWSAEDEQG